ncbi:MAG: DUF2192 domain-containing protein [Desulfurococcales archaeon]|nr:DUF2192 domain-containing protein [Desulfurococcales archaeon]
MSARLADARRRLQVLMDLWLKIVSLWESGKYLERDDVIKMLEETYSKAGLTPLRGASVPPDLYDKEMASLYVVGKYGMGLDKQYPDIFDKIFYKEEKYEEGLRILAESQGDKAETLLNGLFGSLSDNDVARMLRIKLTQVYFGFADESELINLIKNIYEKLPSRRKIAVKYARFYIAFKIAREIAMGKIRNRIVKEIVKQASALNLSEIRGVIPDDAYIASIAKEVFKVADQTLRSTLSLGRKDSGSREGRGNS